MLFLGHQFFLEKTYNDDIPPFSVKNHWKYQSKRSRQNNLSSLERNKKKKKRKTASIQVGINNEERERNGGKEERQKERL